MSSRWLSFPVAFVVWFVCGCGSAGPPPQQITVNVTPATITVRTGDTQQFFATVAGTTNQTVTWSVNGVAGGDATRGTISAAGLYTPPAQPPNPNQVQVMATSAANASATSSAQVTLANPIAIVSFVYPPALVSDVPFSISVIGSKFVSGAQILLGTTVLTPTFVDSSRCPACRRGNGWNGEFPDSAVPGTHVGCQLHHPSAGNEHSGSTVPGIFPKRFERSGRLRPVASARNVCPEPNLGRFQQ